MLLTHCSGSGERGMGASLKSIRDPSGIVGEQGAGWDSNCPLKKNAGPRTEIPAGRLYQTRTFEFSRENQRSRYVLSKEFASLGARCAGPRRGGEGRVRGCWPCPQARQVTERRGRRF